MNEKLLEKIKKIHEYYSTRVPHSQWDSYQLGTIAKLSEAIITLNEEIKNDSKNAKVN